MTVSCSNSGALLFCVLLVCGSPESRLRTTVSSSPRPSLWEFALKKINPADVDYGAELECKRQIFIRQLRDRRMGIEMVGLGLVLSGWMSVLRERREKQRREIISAELLAQYHNALVEARIRLEQAIADNNTLRAAAPSAVNAATAEPALVAEADPAAMFVDSNFPRARSRRQAATTFAQPTATHIAELEQQLSASREREKLLEKQLERIPSPRRSSPPSRGKAQT